MPNFQQLDPSSCHLQETEYFQCDMAKKSSNKKVQKPKPRPKPRLLWRLFKLCLILSILGGLVLVGLFFWVDGRVARALETRSLDSISAIYSSPLRITTLEHPSRSTLKHYLEDRNFIASVFAEIIAPNIKLYEYLEDHKLTWIDDIPLVNTLILKQLKAIQNTESGNFFVPKLYNDTEDKEFVGNLFRKVVLNDKELAKEFAEKTPNWEADRIAEIDTIILKMAICEFLKFPSQSLIIVFDSNTCKPQRL